MQQSRGAREATSVGVIGAEQIVTRIMSVARGLNDPALRLVTAVYDDEAEAHERALSIASRVDVCLFAGPLPYDVAMAPGDLSVPATSIPTGGAALFATLLRAVLEGVLDPTRISIDTVSRADLRDAYEDIGLKTSRVRLMEYDTPASAGKFLDFHRKHYGSGRTTGAVTTVPTVEAALRRSGVPTLKMTPTAASLRNSLNTAILIGGGAKVEESRIVTMIVRAPASALPAQASPSNYWYQETKLSLHHALLREARRMAAAVIPRDECSFLVVATMGSLRLATEDLSVAPFLGRISEELGLPLEVGIGLGRTAREAEVNADSALEKSEQAASNGAGAAFLIGPGQLVLQLSVSGSASIPEPEKDSKGSATLARLNELLDEQNAVERIVDAEQVANLMGVTLRTARRTLNLLVDEGLAWPMPPTRSSKVGRPPRPYQLLTERLPR